MPTEQGNQITEEYIYDEYYHKAHGRRTAEPRGGNQVAALSHALILLLALPI